MKNLARYAFERLGPDDIRLVGRVEGSWTLPARIARPLDTELRVFWSSSPCPVCDEGLWADLPKIQLPELPHHAEWLFVEGAALLHGGGKRARLCPAGARDCEGTLVLDASPALAADRATIWLGPLALRPLWERRVRRRAHPSTGRTAHAYRTDPRPRRGGRRSPLRATPAP